MPRRQAIVDAKTRDGRTLSRRTRRRSRTADNPMTQAEVEAKAFDLIGGVLGARRARAIVRAIAQIETVHRCHGTAPVVATSSKIDCGARICRMTLLLSNEDVESGSQMSDCLEAMEIAYRDLGEMQGANGIRSEVLTPTTRDDALHSLLTMSGVVPRFGIGAVRINSDILTWPFSPAGLRRVKVPAAPNNRYVGLVLLFSTQTGEPLAIYPGRRRPADARRRQLRTGGEVSRPRRRKRRRHSRHRLAGRRSGDGDLRGSERQADSVLQPESRTARSIRARDGRKARR